MSIVLRSVNVKFKAYVTWSLTSVTGNWKTLKPSPPESCGNRKRQVVRACDVVSLLDTAMVTDHHGGLSCFFFLHFFLVSERQMLLIFCERFSWSGQTSLSNGFSGYFHDSTIESNFLFYYSPMSMLFRNKNNKIQSKTRRKISSMSSITKLKDSTWCACFITRWRVFYRCVQLVQAQATQT